MTTILLFLTPSSNEPLTQILLNPDGLYNFGINSMAPTPKSAVLLVPALLLAGLALWTSMTVDAFGIIALGLIVTWRHSGNLLKDSLVITT